MAKSVIIIGAGVAGLSAGCYARMNGYDTRIFEAHDKPGGVCTAWKRGDYTFDFCIHWLIGTKPGSGFHKIWQELGALEGRRVVDHDEYARCEGKDGRVLILHTDVDRLEQHLKELAPGDVRALEHFAACIRRLSRVDMPIDPQGLLAVLAAVARMLPSLGLLRRYSRVSAKQYCERFSDPFIREGLLSWFDLPDFPALAMMLILASMYARNAGYPVGGSLEFARAIERRYLGLGGEVSYRSPVAKILVEGDRAVGVRLRDGSEHRADRVISAADGHSTIFDMLDGRYVDERIRGYYDGGLAPFPPIIVVHLGVAQDLSAEPHMLSFPLKKPVTIGGKSLHRVSCKHYCYDPTMAPRGKSVLSCTLGADYDHWRALAADRVRYDAEKRAIAEAVIAALSERFPGLDSKIEAVDVATPATLERFTGNWRASFEGWLPNTRTMRLMVTGGLPRTLPGLAGFFMIGQWTSIGGGLPPAARDGRDIVKRMCREDRRPFVTTVA